MLTDLTMAMLLAALAGLPLLALCLGLDRLLAHRPALLRRRVWITGILAALLLAMLSLGAPLRLDPAAYWADSADGSAVDAAAATTRARAALNRLLAAPASVQSGIGEHRERSWITALYVAGLLLVLLRMGRSRLAIHRYLRATIANDDPVLLAAAARLSRELALTPPPLRWHPDGRSPAVVGTISHCVLLPPSAAGWSQAELEFALRHELAHIDHHDNAWQALANLHCALQWFNPLVWVARRRLRTAAEMAADAVAARGVAEPAGCAHVLLRLARTLRSSPLPLTGMADHALAARIESLLSPPQDRGQSGAASVAAIAALGLIGALVLVESGGRTRLQGWEPQQIRWESATAAHGLFLHGEVDLTPGNLRIGNEGLLVLVAEDTAGTAACFTWRDRRGMLQWQCEGVADPQTWLDAQLYQAAALWPQDPRSPLAGYWHPADAEAFSGSHITGIPGRSRNPDREIVQAGWIDDAGARVGTMKRRNGFALQFRYDPVSRELDWRLD